jgi:tetratricopeptide (TPR) repeat protein
VSHDDLPRAREAFLRGDFATASELARKSFAAAKASADVAATARSRLLIGHIAYDDLRYGPAREAYSIACRELEQSLGPTNDLTRQARASLSVVLGSLADRDASAAALAAAEAGLQPAAPPMERERCETWLSIACAYAGEGRFTDARGVLELLATTVPPGDAALLATVHLQLASAIDALGDRRAALDGYQRCRELRLQAFGAENPRVADATLAVARSLAATGRIDEAKQMATEAIDCMTRLGHELRPRMSTGWATLGMTTLLAGDVRGGTQHFETACKIEEKTFGAAHPATAGMLIMLAQVHGSLNDHGKVAGLCKRIVPALENAPGQEGPLVMACELEVRALCAMGRARDAAQRLSRLIEAVARRRVATSEQMARLYAALGSAEVGSGRRERAIAAFQRARTLAIDAAGADSDLVQSLQQALALLEQGGEIVSKGSA